MKLLSTNHQSTSRSSRESYGFTALQKAMLKEIRQKGPTGDTNYLRRRYMPRFGIRNGK